MNGILHTRWLVLFAVSVLPPALVSADDSVLDQFLGRWQIQVEQLQPDTREFAYQESFERVLEGQFIRGETGTKPDGTRDIIFAHYDRSSDGYPFWVFSSSGSATWLPPASWNARKRVMTWQNPPQFDLSYRSNCEFPRAGFRACYLIMKDWKGKVLSEMKWTATKLQQ